MTLMRLAFLIPLLLSAVCGACTQEGPAPTLTYERGRFGPQPTPKAAVERHLEVLQRRIKDPSLPLYTRDSLKFLRLHLVTDEQQRRESQTLAEGLGMAEEKVRDKFAVLFFPPDTRIPPYLLRQSAKGWVLDLAAMSRLIGFDDRQEWFFRTQSHPWMFAFAEGGTAPGDLPAR